jgi:hypothetical protein
MITLKVNGKAYGITRSGLQTLTSAHAAVVRAASALRAPDIAIGLGVDLASGGRRGDSRDVHRIRGDALFTTRAVRLKLYRVSVRRYDFSRTTATVSTINLMSSVERHGPNAQLLQRRCCSHAHLLRNPDAAFMGQAARRLTDAVDGFLATIAC